MVTYIYLILCGLWMVSLEDKVVIQQGLLIITNIAYLIYLLSQRPYLSIINSIVVPLILVCLVTLESYFIYYELNLDLTSIERTRIIKEYLIFCSIIFMIMILWTIWRCIWDLMDIWNFFKNT